MGLIHIILALFMRTLLAPFVVSYSLIKLIFSFKLGELLNWLHQLAFMIDLFGNYLIKYPANDLLLTKNSIYPYGTNFKTISHITAFNYKRKTLTKLGIFVAKIMILCNDRAFKANKK